MGTCAELLLLHFSAFTIGRRLEVTVSSKEESLLQPSVPYSPCDMYPSSAIPSHVITVSAPKPPPRYQKTYCCLRKNTNPKIPLLSVSFSDMYLSLLFVLYYIQYE